MGGIKHSWMLSHHTHPDPLHGPLLPLCCCSEGPAAHLPAVLRTGVDEGTARATAERLRGIINHGLVKAGAILGGNDLVAALKCFGALYIIGSVGRVITPMGLLYTSECWAPVVQCLISVCGVTGWLLPSLSASLLLLLWMLLSVQCSLGVVVVTTPLHFTSRNTMSAVRL